eukprot:1763994-Amphidinium_carterae.2
MKVRTGQCQQYLTLSCWRRNCPGRGFFAADDPSKAFFVQEPGTDSHCLADFAKKLELEELRFPPKLLGPKGGK